MAKKSEEFERVLKLLHRMNDEELVHLASHIERKKATSDNKESPTMKHLTIDFESVVLNESIWKGLNITTDVNVKVVNFIKWILKESLNVKNSITLCIYSERCKYEYGYKIVSSWCEKNGVDVYNPNFFITSDIPKNSIYISKNAHNFTTTDDIMNIVFEPVKVDKTGNIFSKLFHK